MKTKVFFVALLAGLFMSASAFAQKPTVVKLAQKPGEFKTKHLELTEGEYIFEIHNNGVDHNVGFVLAPQGENGVAGEHIKEAYVKEQVAPGKKVQSNVVDLKPGVYNYFCPLNPTPHYTLTVKAKN